MCRAFLPPMIERGTGDIDQRGLGVAASDRSPAARPYCASKMAVHRADHRRSPSRSGPPASPSTACRPARSTGRGWTATSASRPSGSASRCEEATDAFVSRAALRRMVTEDEVGRGRRGHAADARPLRRRHRPVGGHGGAMTWDPDEEPGESAPPALPTDDELRPTLVLLPGMLGDDRLFESVMAELGSRLACRPMRIDVDDAVGEMAASVLAAAPRTLRPRRPLARRHRGARDGAPGARACQPPGRVELERPTADRRSARRVERTARSGRRRRVRRGRRGAGDAQPRTGGERCDGCAAGGSTWRAASATTASCASSGPRRDATTSDPSSPRSRCRCSW